MFGRRLLEAVSEIMARQKMSSGLVRETSQLRQELERLVATFPEDKLGPDEQILNRILTHDWRHAPGEIYGPHERRYWEAVRWLNHFDAYVQRIHEYCLYTLEDQKAFDALPLTRRLRVPAPECIRRLEIQEHMIDRCSSRTTRPHSPASDRKGLRKLQAQIQIQADCSSLETVAAEVGCNRDTLGDFLAGRTDPRGETLRKLRDYIGRIQVPQREEVGENRK